MDKRVFEIDNYYLISIDEIRHATDLEIEARWPTPFDHTNKEAVKRGYQLGTQAFRALLLGLSAGAGKSLICAELARILVGLSKKKILCLCPRLKLVAKPREIPFNGNEASIYSASIGKSLRHDVVFATEGDV